jgi:hypothetical protein
MVFEIKVLRRVFEPKTEEFTGEWKRLNKEERNDSVHIAKHYKGD